MRQFLEEPEQILLKPFHSPLHKPFSSAPSIYHFINSSHDIPYSNQHSSASISSIQNPFPPCCDAWFPVVFLVFLVKNSLSSRCPAAIHLPQGVHGLRPSVPSIARAEPSSIGHFAQLQGGAHGGLGATAESGDDTAGGIGGAHRKSTVQISHRK